MVGGFTKVVLVKIWENDRGLRKGVGEKFREMVGGLQRVRIVNIWENVRREEEGLKHVNWLILDQNHVGTIQLTG